ncbi:MAG TPA: hypothetical protein VLA58_09375 [Chitinophagaceae bacterium]|nr:hypothetical protein [Chitinophagaceae bacterium]
MNHEKVYYIPARFRRIENMHILFWLIKDACWAVNFKYMALFMIIPTMAVAILITWQTRYIISEFLHNLAVILWITANCTWMVGEFFGWDENLIGPYGLRQFSLIPFILGLMVLFYYYFVLSRRRGFKEKMFRRTDEILEKELSEQ